MEVPDWGDAPDQDYPSFDQPTELPAISNARKKAKRKRKQQQEQQEAQLHVPVRLGKQQKQPDADARVTKKLRTQPEVAEDPHITQVPAREGNVALTSQTHKRDREQTRNAKQDEQLLNATQNRRDKRRAAIYDEDVETTISSAAQPEEGLSTADMAQLLELAQLAKQHNPDLSEKPHVTLCEGPSSSAKVSKHKTGKGTAASNVPDVPAAQATQPTAKPVKKARLGLPGAVGVTKPKAHKHPPAQATDAPAPAPASGVVALTSKVGTAENSVSDAGKVKSSKLGRKARLRLKRQLWRQKQEGSQQAQQQELKGNAGCHRLPAADSDTAVKGPQSDAAAKSKQAKSQKPKEARAAVTAPGKATAVSSKHLQDDKPADLAAAAAAGAGAAAGGGPAKGVKKQNSKQAAAASPAQAVAQELTHQAADKSSKGSKQLNKRGGPAAGLTAAAEHTAGAQKKGKAGLLDQMRSKLSGGRFRMLNEQLYSAPGQDAFEMMQGDPALFEQYHEGFREQTQHWPVQPIDLAIAWLKKKSPDWVAADFGCGDAQLASSVPQTVHSFDLVATAPGVTACNMADVPLGDVSVHAAIFCLALMGTDYGAFLQEAHRVLRPGGLLWIAEVRSRFARADSGSIQGRQNDFAEFLAALKAQGFQVTQQDASNKMFVVFVAKKEQHTGSKVQWPVLKPCLYKRR